jgi:undecaprenyl-phosphate galactose phosphotransferase/putative colanic acid biosynthesis UDP-glucose lipid carrier transferase
VLLATEDELVGSNALSQMQRYGYKVQRVFKLPSSMFCANTRSAELVQIMGDIVKLCSVVEIDCVFILVSWTDFAVARDCLGPLRMLSLPVYLLPDRTVWPILNCQVLNFGPGSAIEVKRAPLNKSEQVCKRTVDCTLACLMLILLAPLLVVVAALIKIDDQGPVFFRQTRNGFNGKPFRIVKFRTMSTLEDGQNIRQVTKNDPRVTAIGGVLRRTSIDELPQLVNVLAGDMSLVGPRPHASAHNSQYEWLIANYACRHHVRPGLTGWAQVNGFRGETDTLDAMQKRVERDLWYIDNWSMWLDFKILIKTLGVGLQPTAY